MSLGWGPQYHPATLTEWCLLGSPAQVEQPAAGPNGATLGTTTFVNGYDWDNFGSAALYDANGEATLIINPLTEGTLEVTVTKHNYLPWEGTAQISEGSLTDGILLIGLITNLESNGDYLTSNAIIVFYLNVNSLASNLYSTNEHIVVSDNYQGYIGPNFICGVFSAAVT